jgi:hypothetical protein
MDERGADQSIYNTWYPIKHDGLVLSPIKITRTASMIAGCGRGGTKRDSATAVAASWDEYDTGEGGRTMWSRER